MILATGHGANSGSGGNSTTPSSSSSSRIAKRRRAGANPRRALAIKQSMSLATHPVFLGLMALAGLALLISFFLVLSISDEPDAATDINAVTQAGKLSQLLRTIPQQVKKKAANVLHRANKMEKDTVNTDNNRGVQRHEQQLDEQPHLYPPLPYLPAFAKIENGDALAAETLSGTKPTIAGVAVVMNRFLQALHDSNTQMAQRNAEVPEITSTYFHLVDEHLQPFEEAYRGRSVFPVREDGSIFLSLAAFREHLLGQTLRSAFSQATDPEKLFVGAIVQNCFGLDVQCRTGLQVVGKNAAGRDMTKVSDAPPDKNGIEEFCTDPTYKRYCDEGHVRALYVNETDSLGPAVARYYASKIWGGETYYLQMDSHLEFAPEWDRKYIDEVKATKSYPKSVLSAYPPGFQNFGTYKGGTPGPRMCTCEFSTSEVEDKIIRINTGGRCSGDEPKPTQIAFIAAGFFFAHASFLKDVPFDPYLPWCFMGEEIALSMRAWTQGWGIYAPRRNLIAHQYRPGRLGLPKFWESVGRSSGRPGLNTRLQKHVLRRVKYMVGYPEDTREKIEADGDQLALTQIENYSLGQVRSRDDYLQFTGIDPVAKVCPSMPWCIRGELE